MLGYSDEDSAFLDKQKRRILDMLSELHISFKLESHDRVFTVETAEKATGHLQGVHSKNLFLVSTKKKFFLIVCEAKEPIDLKAIGKFVGAGVRFANHNDLRDKLGVLAGSVNPFSIVFDEKQDVQLVFSKQMMKLSAENQTFWFHPGSNDATVGISFEDLKRFLKGRNYLVLE